MSHDVEASVLIVSRRPRGRPTKPEPSTAVCVWVPVSAADRLIHRASQDGLSVSRLVREFLTRHLDELS